MVPLTAGSVAKGHADGAPRLRADRLKVAGLDADGPPMSSSPASDRRRHPRFAPQCSAVLLARRGPPVPCTVENLSAGGALLSSERPLPTQGPLRVCLRLSPRRDVSVDACVVRAHPTVDGRHRHAVAFTEVPAVVQDLLQSAALRALSAESPQLHVLVVDDEPVVRGALARELRALGAAARPVAGPFEALLRLQDQRPHYRVAIVDAQLGAEDGVEVLRQLAGEHPGVRRVLMSGRVAMDELMRVQASGLAQQVFAKPWQRADLERALQVEA